MYQCAPTGAAHRRMLEKNVKIVEKEATPANLTVELTPEELEPALNRANMK